MGLLYYSAMTTLPMRYSVLGVNISAVELDDAADLIVEYARARQPLAVSALAVHGVMTGRDPVQRYRLNHMDILTADGQPVRWALRLLYGVRLARRVYGPELTLALLQRCEAAGVSIYFYGSTPQTLAKLTDAVQQRFPALRLAGCEPSRFRTLTRAETDALVKRIQDSGAGIVCCGLGCPRQETWAFELRDALGVPILAVGAAFDFLGGSKAQAPRWMQDRGLEWLFRLLHEPRRLWRRYLLLNPAYLLYLAAQKVGWKPDTEGCPPSEPVRWG